MHSAPTLKDPSTAGALPDTLEMESHVSVSLGLVIPSKATPPNVTQIEGRRGVKREMRMTYFFTGDHKTNLGNGIRISAKTKVGNGILAKFGLGKGIYTPSQDPRCTVTGKLVLISRS